MPFAERLVRLQDQGQDGELTVVREDFHVLHRALHVAAGHADDDLIPGCRQPGLLLQPLGLDPEDGL